MENKCSNQMLQETLMALLRLKRQPVGVKLAHTKEEYDAVDAREL